MFARVAIVVYFIWQGMSNCYWLQCIPNMCTIKQIRSIIRARIGTVLPKKISRKDHEWFLNL